MARAEINDKYSLLRNERRFRLVDRVNGAVVVDFVLPSDVDVSEFCDALQKNVDATSQTKPATKAKKLKIKRVKSDEGANGEEEKNV